jgi:hypothetical protein
VDGSRIGVCGVEKRGIAHVVKQVKNRVSQSGSLTPNFHIPPTHSISMAVNRSSPTSVTSPPIYRVAIKDEPAIDFLAELEQSMLLQASAPISPPDLLVNL